MAEKLKYRRPALVNMFDIDTQISNEVWVTAAFVKPGSHTFMVSDFRGKGKESNHSNMHECTVDPREEEIVTYERVTKLRTGDVFHRHKTIFAGWPNENEITFR